MTPPYNPWDPRPFASATLTAEAAEKTDHWIKMQVTLEVDAGPALIVVVPGAEYEAAP